MTYLLSYIADTKGPNGPKNISLEKYIFMLNSRSKIPASNDFILAFKECVMKGMEYQIEIFFPFIFFRYFWKL